MAKNENMKTFRIGNEIQVRWPILTNGEESSLSGRDLTLILSDQWGNDREVKTFGTEGNVIVFTFLASDQFKTGVYRLTLYENYGKVHQVATDYCFAFKLVAHSCDIPSDMASNELPLDSTNVDVGIHGLSAYEIAVNYGYEGSEEQWMAEFHTVLTSTQLIVESVERSELVLRRSEELFEGLSTLQQSEQGRIDAEAIRVENENHRVHNETDRQNNERQRVQAETQRAETFVSSEQQRQQTFQSSEQQRDHTASESESQRQQNFNTGESLRQQTFENNEGQRESRLTEVISDVQNAESLRQSAESDRQVAEEERASSESTRRLNENTRQASETTRNSNESYRRQQETRRASAEDERVQNELLRQSAERSRLEQDDVIAEAERLRVAAEQRRVVAESERAAAEQSRARVEEQRVAAELQREHDTAAAISGIATEIQAKHSEYTQTINEAVSQAQSDVQTAINDWNRTRRVAQTESEVSIHPNVKNIWSSPMQELTITFVAGANGYDNEYMIQFQCPSDSVTVLNLPSSVKWVNDEPIDLQEGWIYQISIIDNLAVYAGWEAATV